MTGKYDDTKGKDYEGGADGPQGEEHRSKATTGCTGF